jgi:hypothetical protein
LFIHGGCDGESGAVGNTSWAADGGQEIEMSDWDGNAGVYKTSKMMNVKATYYLDTTSSWCYWAGPA